MNNQFKVFLMGLLAFVLIGASAPTFADQTALSKAQEQRQEVQPGNNAPVWRAAASGESFDTQVKGRETGVLINKSGEVWRQIRNDRIIQYGGWAISVVFLLIVAFYLIKGPIKLPEKRTGKLIERFTSAERVTHWTLAFCFVALAVTGLLLMFGKYVIAPWLGLSAFSWIAILSKNVHNFVGPLFSVSLVVFFLMYVKDNFLEKNDIKWVTSLGGATGHVPSGRFNMGEKIWFWFGVTLLGIAVCVTGYILDFPNFDQVRLTMQQAHVVHATAAVVFICMALGHIYIGSIGMEGALEAMRDGYVDESWAKAHHEDWYKDVKSGKIPAVRSKEGAEVLGSQALSS